MPYVTWSRSIPAPKYSAREVPGPSYASAGYKTKSSGVPVALHGGGTQTTYSFRTGKTLGPDEYENLSGEELRGRVAFEHRTRYDNGHEFQTEKLNCLGISHPEARVRTSASSSWYWEYRGPIWPSIYDTNYYPTPNFPTTSKIHEDGMKAIRRTIPTKPEASLMVFIGELNDKLPQLFGSIARKKGLGTESIGGEYLNYEFGVKPFIQDLVKMAKAVKDFKRVLDEFDERSQAFVRRKTELYHTTRDVVLTPVGGGVGMFNLIPRSDMVYDYFESYPTSFNRTDSFTDRAWFSGSFSYFLQKSDDFYGRMVEYEQKANYLLGTRITPSTVWELTPWSWLIDWNFDVGGYLATLESFSSDSLVLRYGYVMHQTDAKRVYTSPKPLISRGGQNIGTLSISYSQVRKTRTRANPYGFGSPSNYSSKQWAILGALGMTKSPGNLRID